MITSTLFLLLVVSFFVLVPNGSGIGEGRHLKYVSLNLAQKFNRSTKAEVCTSALLLPIPCYLLPF